MCEYGSAARRVALLLGMVALWGPAAAGAQTVGQRARELEVRARIEQVRARMEQARAQMEQAQARMEQRLQEARQVRMGELEEVRVRERQAAEAAGVLTQEQLRRLEDRLRVAREQLRVARRSVTRLQTRIRLGVSLDAGQGAEYDSLGARVAGVMEDSPAQEIGLREGDIITRLDGHSLLEPIPDEEGRDFDQDESLPVQRLMALAGELEPGEEASLEYLRDGRPHTTTFTAADLEEPTIAVVPGGGRIRFFQPGEGVEGFRWYYSLPRDSLLIFRGDSALFLRGDSLRYLRLPDWEHLRDSLRIAMPEIHVDSLPLRGLLYGVTPRRGDQPLFYDLREGDALLRAWSVAGLQLAEMNPGLGAYFSTDEGVLVLDVAEDSELGLEPGDVVLTIDGRNVENPGDVRRILASYRDGEAISFTVMRKGEEVQVRGVR